MVNKEFINRLKAAVETFADDGAQMEFQDILTLVFEGLRKNYSVTVAYVVDVKNQERHLYAQKFEDGSESALIFTEEADLRNKSTIELTLRAILDDMNRNEVCDGFIINPGEGDVFISKILLQTALNAGYAYAQEEIERKRSYWQDRTGIMSSFVNARSQNSSFQKLLRESEVLRKNRTIS